ncbi:amidohydrolase family protein [Candidatus Peregrinibacteria bacterium]|nr:amidohydrolase family protein [Candidatus Peregrinibacteria bacterium]
MGKIYKGTIINPVDAHHAEVMHHGFIEVDDHGRIIDKGIRKMADRDEEPVIMPAFVDVHVHLPQFDVRGSYSGNQLLLWLKKYIWPEEAKCSDNAHVKDIAQRFYDDLIRHGTLTAGIYGTIHENAVKTMIEAMPIRGRVGKVVMDQQAPDSLSETTREAIEVTERLCEQYGDRHMVTPRFAPSCSFEVMRQLAEIAQRYNCYIQTHLSENDDEIALVKKLFPEYRHYTDVYKQAGLLGEKTIVGHVIHCHEEELTILKETGTQIAHCPTSNVALKSGTMPLDDIVRHHIPFALGTDVGAGPKTSMLDVMRAFLDVHDSVHATPTAALYYATKSGAQVLGYSDETGSLDIKKSADFLILKEYKQIDQSLDEYIRFLTHKSDYDTIVEKTYYKGKALF